MVSPAGYKANKMKFIKTFLLFLLVYSIIFGMKYLFSILHTKAVVKFENNSTSGKAVLLCITLYFGIFFKLLSYVSIPLIIIGTLQLYKVLTWCITISVIVACAYATYSVFCTMITARIEYSYKSGFLWAVAFFYNWFNSLIINSSLPAAFNAADMMYSPLAEQYVPILIFIIDLILLIFSLIVTRKKMK